MNNTRINEAIAEMESAAQNLIGKAECCVIGTTGWERVNQRRNLLEAAREYASKLRKIARLTHE